MKLQDAAGLEGVGSSQLLLLNDRVLDVETQAMSEADSSLIRGQNKVMENWERPAASTSE